jgi:glycosyltransferase involved in cell wall biosynthesis
MHIVILYQYYLSENQPGHSRVNELAKIWSNSGHKISVITGQSCYMNGTKNSNYYFKLFKKENDGKVDVFRCFVPNNFNNSFYSRFLSYLSFAMTSIFVFFIKVKKPDMILASSPPLTIGFSVLFIKLFSKIPVLFEVRDLWPESMVSNGALSNKNLIKIFYWLEQKCYRKSDRINTLTPAFKENILKRNLAIDSKIWTIPCGVDTKEMVYLHNKSKIRSNMKWSNKFIVLYTGAFGVSNDLHQIIECANLLKANENIHFALVGNGMEKETLIRHSKKYGLKNVSFHNAVPKKEMASIISAADVCIATLKKSDTFKTVYPNKIFDYLSCSKPVIVAIEGEIKKLLEPYNVGIFTIPEEPIDLKDAVSVFYEDRELLEFCGSNGRQFAVNQFDRMKLASEYISKISDEIFIQT